MALKEEKPKILKPEDIDPGHMWDRAVPAPGQRNVDFEERVNFTRLHNYRLARLRAAVANTDMGAMLCFDNNNIRYMTSTVIGEWSRDKLTRFSLLTGNGEPYIWDFGSAALHHRLYAPWLQADHCRAGLLGMRGMVPPSAGLMRGHAEEIKAILVEEGVADQPENDDYIEQPILAEV